MEQELFEGVLFDPYTQPDMQIASGRCILIYAPPIIYMHHLHSKMISVFGGLYASQALVILKCQILLYGVDLSGCAKSAKQRKEGGAFTSWALCDLFQIENVTV